METTESVQNYYGRVLKSKEDLQTSACCVADGAPPHVREVLKDIHPETQQRFYGCGSPIPSELEGRTVLDLGCGTGRDCFIFSKLVGEKGKVIGVDMTDEQLSLAHEHQEFHSNKFGYKNSNIRFVKGYIEDLSQIVESESVDIVTSNCVINLSPDKKAVFSEIFRVLKPGGELYFSDVFSDRRIPADLREDPVLLGECLSGALYIEDFRRLLAGVGCVDYRVVSKAPLAITNPQISKKTGMIEFYSITVRAFKVELEDICENFGHVAIYKGTITEAPHAFMLDDHHLFKKDMPVPICGNTANMLGTSRLAKHFKITGDFSKHFGPFDCTSGAVSPDATTSPPAGSCC